jgi:periplasmic divalent cation tolerance protein
MSTPYRVVLVTAPRGEVSRKLANALLKARLAACVSLVPSVSSFYWWEGKIEEGEEVLMVIKTRKERFKKCEALIKKLHPYSSPEIISLPIDQGTSSYLHWIHAETK